MKIVVIDGQGGGIGKALISLLKSKLPKEEIIAIGTNSIASEAMRKVGADIVACGENAIKVNVRKADYILGPIGIIVADSLNGEISPDIAISIAQSEGKKILIPFNKCDTYIVGLKNDNLNDLLKEAIELIK